jgi:hypothetical protein
MPEKISFMGTSSIHAIAIRILKNSKPLTPDELAKKISKYREFRGETPNRTVSAILNRSIHVKSAGNGRYTIIPNSFN